MPRIRLNILKKIKLKILRKMILFIGKAMLHCFYQTRNLLRHGPMKKTVIMNIDQTIKKIERTANLKSNWNKKAINGKATSLHCPYK